MLAIGSAAAALVLAASLLLIFLLNQPAQEPGVLDALESKAGYIRTVGEEEYAFYRNLVARDSEPGADEGEIDRLTREKINRVNAEFMLANQMGLCEPYSFETLQRDMQRENDQRKIKKQNSEVFYGPEKFDLISYYSYLSGNLKLDMVTYVVENADGKLVEAAKAYYEQNMEKYQSIANIRYTLTENGASAEKTLPREEMSTLEKLDSELFEFLYNGSVGDELHYTYNDRERSVKIQAIEQEETSFESSMAVVMRDYVTNVYLENLIVSTMEKSPVEFAS